MAALLLGALAGSRDVLQTVARPESELQNVTALASTPFRRIRTVAELTSNWLQPKAGR